MTERRLDGHTALVTGASKGIGRAIALALAREGARVMLSARHAPDLERTAEEFRKEGLSVATVSGDVGREQDADAVVKRTVQEFGGLSILVNNAGIGIFKPVMEMAVAEFDAMWSTNMRGVFLLTRLALPHMVTAGRGEIVNIASLAGKNTFTGGAGYCATKWALRGFAGSLMLEVRDRNIRVVTICPGSVDTTFMSHGKKGESIPGPEDVAAAVLFALTAPARAMLVKSIFDRPVPGRAVVQRWSLPGRVLFRWSVTGAPRVIFPQ